MGEKPPEQHKPKNEVGRKLAISAVDQTRVLSIFVSFVARSAGSLIESNSAFPPDSGSIFIFSHIQGVIEKSFPIPVSLTNRIGSDRAYISGHLVINCYVA